MSTKNPLFPKNRKMSENKEFFKNHHAYLVSSFGDDYQISVKKFLKENFDFESSGNPDYWQKDIETFGIEDSRELKEAHSKKPFKEGGTKVFVVKTDSITLEAQNALLKILEDPLPRSFFFFFLPFKDSLLPTLLSRFMPFEQKPSTQPEETPLPFEISVFLNISPQARLKLLAKIVASKDKMTAFKFLDLLESTLRNKVNLRKITKEEEFALQTVIKSRSYLNSRSASIKTILENISLVVPQL